MPLPAGAIQQDAWFVLPAQRVEADRIDVDRESDIAAVFDSDATPAGTTRDGLTAGDLSIGQIIAFNMIAGRVSGPILRLVQLWQDFQQAGIALKRLGDTLNSPAEAGYNPGRATLPKLIGAVEFDHVTFRYAPNRTEVLNDIRLKIAPGEVIGIVGHSGSGKSTLTKLVQRLVAAESGRVLIDRNDPVLHSQWREYHNRLDTLQAEKNKRQAEYAAAVQQTQKLDAILPIISQRSRAEKTLVDKSLFPKQQYLETEQQRLTVLFDWRRCCNTRMRVSGNGEFYSDT
ncbi:MAG: ATP-binding cassette domain-containing protein [Methylococcales bacterium]